MARLMAVSASFASSSQISDMWTMMPDFAALLAAHPRYRCWAATILSPFAMRPSANQIRDARPGERLARKIEKGVPA
jgi:hypothetical protein